jgi:hypothetical protein
MPAYAITIYAEFILDTTNVVVDPSLNNVEMHLFSDSACDTPITGAMADGANIYFTYSLDPGYQLSIEPFQASYGIYSDGTYTAEDYISSFTLHHENIYYFQMPSPLDPSNMVVLYALLERTSYGLTYAHTDGITTGGNYTTSVSSQTKDGTVTVTPVPETGYEVDVVKYTYSETDYPVYFNGSSYSFSMPASAVVVSVTFKKTTY